MTFRSLPPRAFVLRLVPFVTVAALAMLAPVACGSNSAGFADGGVDARVTAEAGKTDVVRLGGDSGAGQITKLVISPAASMLTVTSFAAPPPTETLKAIATFANKTSGSTAASWSVDRLDIATIAGTGVLTPTGNTFGVVTVTASVGGQMAQATVTVVASAKLNPQSLPSATTSALDSATTTDPGVTTFAYPYDQTVFPEGLLPPEQMWNGGAMGDDYSLEYTGTDFDLTTYFTADPHSQLTLPASVWEALTTTVAGSDVAVTLRRYSGGTAYVSAKQSWHIAAANLGGTIYYWAIDKGQIEKIDLKTGTTSVVFGSGPANAIGTPVPPEAGAPTFDGGPWQDNGSGLRCVACHSVSKNGATLTSVFSRQASTGPLGFVSIASETTQAIGDYGLDATYDALTPDGTLAVMNTSTKVMQLLSTTTAAPIASALDGQTNLCDPSFSPDGTKLALATNCDPGFGWPVEYRQSDLSFYSFANAAPYFSGLTTVVTSMGQGDALAFPSFSPDSSYIFFQRGSYSRAKYTDASNALTHGIDDLYVVAAAAASTPIALAQANNPNGVLPADSQHLNYAPTVNPISAGGYIWVVFTSPRDYGNVMVSPQGAAPMDATYSNHKQLWVTAVDANLGTTDPSHPPFWLPGQDASTANMFGYWALSPCLPTAGDAASTSSCTSGFECCSGLCRDNGSGPVCVASATGCHQVGEVCTVSSDCCSVAGVSCVAGICQGMIPK